jgi:hypothetical protein
VSRSAGQEQSKTSYLPGLDMSQQWHTTIDLANLEEQQIEVVYLHMTGMANRWNRGPAKDIWPQEQARAFKLAGHFQL